MNELQWERRITENEQRCKSNTHRIDKLEPIVDEIHVMSKTMVELVQELKHTNEAVNILDSKVDRMDSRVDEMEKAPAQKWTSTKSKVFDKALDIIIGFLMAGVLWAAVQIF